MKIFCLATNMAENMSKRDMLGMGGLAGDPTLNTPPDEWRLSDDKKTWIAPGWVKPGEWVISLGVPIGNECGDFGSFYGGLYTGAKNSLKRERSTWALS